MARFALALISAAVMIAAVSAQQYDFFGGFAPRDPRQNTGPVTFPVTQPGAETSGVRVGASGYGFVPPGHRGGKKIIVKMVDEEENSEDDGEIDSEDDEDITMQMARAQLAKMLDLERARGAMLDGMMATESKMKESKFLAEEHHEEIRDKMETSISNAEKLADDSIRQAEERMLLVMEKWKFGKYKV